MSLSMPPKHRVKRLKTIKSMPEEQILFAKVAPDKQISVYVNVAGETVFAVALKIWDTLFGVSRWSHFFLNVGFRHRRTRTKV